MKLVKFDANKVGTDRRTMSDNYGLLMQFAEGGYECAKVEDWTQKNAAICAGSLRASIKRYRMFGIGCVVRGDNVFLIRK